MTRATKHGDREAPSTAPGRRPDDAENGRAWRLLCEALTADEAAEGGPSKDGWWLSVQWYSKRSVGSMGPVVVTPKRWSSDLGTTVIEMGSFDGDSLAEAADKCRAALS